MVIVGAMAMALDERVAFGCTKVFLHHLRYELLERDLRSPAQLFLRLAWIAEQRLDFSRTEIARVHCNDAFARRGVPAFLLALAPPCDRHGELTACGFDELPHAVLLTT